jgi:hypothetical protein
MRRRPRLAPADLFGQIAVSEADLTAWLDALPRLSRSPWRRALYARTWNIADKVRAAKTAGQWPPSDVF